MRKGVMEIKTYVCKVCGHINFDEAPVRCPVCEAPIENFEYKEDAIKRPADINNLSEAEKKHIPLVTIKKECTLISDGCTDVYVRVGEIEHVMESEHYITFIDFYIDGKYIARLNLTPRYLHPATVLHLNLANKKKLTVIENCNIHGHWMTEVTIGNNI